MKFTKDSINIDPVKETAEITSKLRENVTKKLKKRGAVVGISGGIDSSVVLALCAKTFGPDRVLGVMMPENDSNPDSLELAKKLSSKFNTKYVVENMTEAVAGFGCYKRRDEAIKNVFPEFNSNYKAKIILPTNLLEKESLNVFHLTIIAPDGTEKSERMPLKEYLQIVAASNFKQRSRMSMLYYHAEARNYAVIGTGNKNEHEQGFFVKYGDGGADIKPIAYLFKTQVFQLAEYLEVPEEIRKRTPTTDTYSAEQTQEEFFYRVPFDILDRVWFGWEKGISSKTIAEALELTEENVESIIHDTQRKIRTTEYLRMEPL
ncbi:MAG: NAD(+) synthase [Ignavibacteriaceae bacterium]|jgi:NAD+ synthase|nr:NAD(+) synthase [Ignavibacteriaceae bacterium]MCU0413665.1 NAD(+) synthase [Ignavibacteriaceae bacterium]